MEEAKDRRTATKAESLSEDETRRQQEIATIELSRTRVIRELDATMNPRRRVQLRAALAHLNSRLAELKG
jgi:CHASE3 domain sensor protein